MVDITKAFSILNSLLIEAQLKDSFSSMADGNMVRLVLKDGSERAFEIVENLAGRIVMVDKQSEIWYTFTKDAMVDSILTLHEYDSDKKSSKFEGKEEKLSVKEFLTGKSGGDIEIIKNFVPSFLAALFTSDRYEKMLLNTLNESAETEIEKMGDYIKKIVISSQYFISRKE